MLADWFAEGRALLGVANRVLECRLPDPDRARGHVDPSDLERAHHLLEALPLLAADQIAGRDCELLEQHLASVDSLVAELFDVAADGRTVLVLFDREHADPGISRL